MIHTLFISAAIISRFLYLSETAFFINDQGRDALAALTMVLTHKLVLIGPATSFNSVLGSFYFGPYYYYLLVPFVVLVNSPLLLTGLVPLLFVFVIILFWSLGNFSKETKIIFSILATSSAYCLLYTRFLWNLNVGFLLSALVFFAYVKWEKNLQKNIPSLLFFGLINGIVFQTHYGTIFLFLTFIFILISPVQKKIAYAIGFAASFIPFVLFDIRHEFLLLRTGLGVIQSFSNFSPSGQSGLVGALSEMFNAYLFPNLISDQRISGILFLGLLFLLGAYLYNNRQHKIHRSLFVMSVVFFLSYMLFRRAFTYYLATYILFYYLILSLWLSDMLKRKKGYAFTIVLFLIVFGAYNSFDYIQHSFEPFTLTTQEYLAKKIAQFPHSYVSARPHDDDKKGIEYILLTRYNMKNAISNGGGRFVVCFDLARCGFSKTENLITTYHNAALFYKQAP